MNKLELKANKKALIGFLTAGDPSLEKTKEFMKVMVKAGVDVIEIGIPFSDPVAEGPVVQSANVRALSTPKGCTPRMVLEAIGEVRKEIPVPIVVYTYLNPVYKYGYDEFCAKCNAVGVDSLLIPDLPYEEKAELEEIAKKYNVSLMAQISTESGDRIPKIAADAEGYLRLITTIDQNPKTTEAIVKKAKEYTDVPVLIEIGIGALHHAKEYCDFVDGIIVGNEFVAMIGDYGDNAAPFIEMLVRTKLDEIN